MIPSPCVNICTMDDGLCVGCRRTLDEIANWMTASDEEKRAILEAIKRRPIADETLRAM